MRLAGKVALITGAAAGVEGEVMGFGGAAARLFAQHGAKVVLTDILEDKGQRTAEQIQADGGDVTCSCGWTSPARKTGRRPCRPRCRASAASTSWSTTPAPRRASGIEETTVDIWDGQMDVHAKGVFLGTKFAIPEMRKAGGGSIINISSIYGIVGSPYSTAYHAAKGAIRTFTKTAAIQCAADNIRVNSIHPGFCRTPLTDDGYNNEVGRYQWCLDRTPIGRLGNADDIAYGMLYLASDESRYVTGAELVIDGGMTAQ